MLVPFASLVPFGLRSQEQEAEYATSISLNHTCVTFSNASRPHGDSLYTAKFYTQGSESQLQTAPSRRACATTPRAGRGGAFLGCCHATCRSNRRARGPSFLSRSREKVLVEYIVARTCSRYDSSAVSSAVSPRNANGVRPHMPHTWRVASGKVAHAAAGRCRQ